MKFNPEKIDLHVHTLNSDGEYPLEEVVKRAKKSGITLMAITDHNFFTLEKNCNMDGVELIPGAEFSTTYMQDNADEANEIHIIGLFPNGVDKASFSFLFDRIPAEKKKYVEAILDDLSSRGLNIYMSEVEEINPGCRKMGRHQIAQVMVKKGYAETITQALDEQIGNYSPYYIPATRFIRYAPMEVVIKKIIEEGGIPILAHPFGYRMNTAGIEELIRYFKECLGNASGGVEVFYEEYVKDMGKMKFLKAMKRKYNLLASAAGDFHGDDDLFASQGDYELYQQMLNCINK